MIVLHSRFQKPGRFRAHDARRRNGGAPECHAFLRKESGRRNPLKDLTTRVRYKGNCVIVTRECPKEDLGKSVKKLRGIIALPEEA